MRKLRLFLLTWFFYFASSQDIPSIYGKLSLTSQPLSDTELNAIATKCYSGLHMKTCKSVIPTDDAIYGYDSQYYKITLANTAQLYCLQCCGLNPKRVDNWDIHCTLDTFTAITSNLYGYEFRLGTQSTLGGFDFISCPLKRKACTYSASGGLISCAATDNHHLHGYELTLTVVRYTNNFESWRGISSCSAVAFESNVTLSAGDVFTESIRMSWNSAPFDSSQPVSLAFFSLFGVLVLFIAVYFGRKKHCPICTKKLVLFPNRCYVCVFVGAEVPDPVMLRALEAKGRRIIDGSSRPRQTLLQSVASCSRWFGNLLTKSFDYLCCRRKITSVHLIEVSEERHKAIEEDVERGNRDLELQSNQSKGNRKDSPEKQYYTKASKGDKSGRTVVVLDPATDSIEVATLIPNTPQSPSFLPLPSPHPPSSASRNIVARFSPLPATVVPKDLATRLDKNLKLKIGTFKSVVAAKSPKIKKFISRFHVPDKNPRLMNYPLSTIANAIDDEYSNQKPSGISKNKFKMKKHESIALL